MRRLTAALVIAAAALTPRAAAAAGPLQRYALVVGANSGGADRPQLQYAISDAERFARVMVELGGVPPANEIVLRQPKLKELVDALDPLTRRVTEAQRTAGAGGRTEVLLYYSGHADEQGLLLGDDRYSYRTLRDRLDQIPADVRIAVLDACSSGAFTRAQGRQGAAAVPRRRIGRHARPCVPDLERGDRSGAGIRSHPRLVLHALPGLRLPRRRGSRRATARSR